MEIVLFFPLVNNRFRYPINIWSLSSESFKNVIASSSSVKVCKKMTRKVSSTSISREETRLAPYMDLGTKD